MKELVSKEVAKKLKELGYNRDTYNYWEIENGEWSITTSFNGYKDWLKYFEEYPEDQTTIFAAPSVSSALDWIREEKGVACGVSPTYHQSHSILDVWYMYSYFSAYTNQKVKVIKSSKKYATHPLAESALLESVIKYIEENSFGRA